MRKNERETSWQLALQSACFCFLFVFLRYQLQISFCCIYKMNVVDISTSNQGLLVDSFGT